MSILWSCVLSLLAADGPGTVDAALRQPAVLLVVTPQGAASGAGTSRWLRAASEVLGARTDLRIISAEQAGLDADTWTRCPRGETFTCWVRAVRAAPVRSSSTAEQEHIRWLLVFSVQPGAGGRDRLTLMLIDTDRASRLLSAAHDVEDAEDAIFASLRRPGPVEVDTGDEVALSAALGRAAEQALKEELEQAGRWMPFGSVELDVPCAGCALSVDGRLLATHQRRTRIVGLAPGPRRIELGGGQLRCAHQVEVGRGAEVRLEAAECGDRAPSTWAKPALRYGGLGVAALGGGLTVWGALRAANGPATLCFARPGSEEGCVGLGTPRLATSAAMTPALDPARARPPGVALIPLGVAFAAMGAAWVAGAELGEEEQWWLLLGCSVLGAAAIYGTGAWLGATR